MKELLCAEFFFEMCYSQEDVTIKEELFHVMTLSQLSCLEIYN